MRFGLQIDTPPFAEGSDHFAVMLAMACEAEVCGFESVWYEDHFMWRDDEHPEQPSPRLECFLTLAALAAATTTIRVGALVTGVPYRNPALAAKMWTTLDLISQGRAIIGMGAAWHRQEFEAYGWQFGSISERMEQLEDALHIMHHMCTERPASYVGHHYSIDRALNDPPPVQRPHPPILVGGGGERRTLRLVARYADMANVYGSVDEVARKFRVLREHCDDVGRSYEEITRTVNMWTLLAVDEDNRARQRERFPDVQYISTPAETVAAYREYEEVGMQYAIVKLLDGTGPEPVRFFAETVMSAFASV